MNTHMAICDMLGPFARQRRTVTALWCWLSGGAPSTVHLFLARLPYKRLQWVPALFPFFPALPKLHGIHLGESKTNRKAFRFHTCTSPSWLSILNLDVQHNNWCLFELKEPKSCKVSCKKVSSPNPLSDIYRGEFMHWYAPHPHMLKSSTMSTSLCSTEDEKCSCPLHYMWASACVLYFLKENMFLWNIV